MDIDNQTPFEADALPLFGPGDRPFITVVVKGTFVLQPGVVIQLPESPFTDGVSYGSIIVTISQEGMMFFNDERTTLGGLASAFSQAAHEDEGATLLIEADRRVSHGTIVEIYNMALAAGIREVALGTRVSAPEGTVP